MNLGDMSPTRVVTYAIIALAAVGVMGVAMNSDDSADVAADPGYVPEVHDAPMPPPPVAEGPQGEQPATDPAFDEWVEAPADEGDEADAANAGGNGGDSGSPEDARSAAQANNGRSDADMPAMDGPIE